MKKAYIWVIAFLFFAGCNSGNREMNRAMDLRTKMIQAKEVSFDTDITADYGDKVLAFSLRCSFNGKGNMEFSVTAPETLAGITGTISEGDGTLTFDGTALSFVLLTDDRLSPVSAPWILMKALRSGYLTAAGMEGDQLRLTVNDSYEEDALQLDVWLGDADLPQHAEVLWEGRKILSLNLTSVRIL